MLATATMGGARKPPGTKCEDKMVYWPRQLACATWGGHCYYQLLLNLSFFSLFFSFFLFFSSSRSISFDPLQGKLPRLKICFPQYFGITRRCLQKKCDFYFVMAKKADFRAFFLLFTANIQSPPPGPPLVPGVFIHLFDFYIKVILH